MILEVCHEISRPIARPAAISLNGNSESFVGELIRDHRESVVLSTKYTCTVATGDANAGGNHRKSMVQALESSLRRLRTDYIDLYWLHVWDQMTPVEEVMRGFDDLVRQGKVLYIGVSDAPAWWIARANTLAELRGWTQFVGLQIEYSLIERTVERELVPLARALKLGLIAWGPLAGGVLSGKYHLGQVSEGRYRNQTGEASSRGRTGERVDRIVSTLTQVAAETGRSAAQVALAWLRHRDIPVIAILGARRAEQLRDNLACLDLNLSPERLTALDAASSIELGFPYDSLYKRERIARLVYGGLRDRILTS